MNSDHVDSYYCLVLFFIKKNTYIFRSELTDIEEARTGRSGRFEGQEETRTVRPRRYEGGGPSASEAQMTKMQYREDFLKQIR